ncbi:MAG: hypothetical protein ACXQTP_05430, partial [Candidatus Methanofastidiosia archaeon]
KKNIAKMSSRDREIAKVITSFLFWIKISDYETIYMKVKLCRGKYGGIFHKHLTKHLVVMLKIEEKQDLYIVLDIGHWEKFFGEVKKR